MPVCHGQSKNMLEIENQSEIIQVSLPSNFRIDTLHGFDSKTYRARSEEQDILIESEVGFKLSTTRNSNNHENKVGSQLEIIELQEGNYKLQYFKTNNKYRNIEGELLFLKDSEYVKCLNFEAAESNFQYLIEIFSNIKIKRQ